MQPHVLKVRTRRRSAQARRTPISCSRAAIGQAGLHDGVGIQRCRIDALLHQEAGKFGYSLGACRQMRSCGRSVWPVRNRHSDSCPDDGVKETARRKVRDRHQS